MGFSTLDITLRPMAEADLDQVMAIESASFSCPWNRQHFLAELAAPHAFPLVACSGSGEVAGYLCPSLVADEGEILDVAVAPAWRGQGIGRLLLAEAMADCRSRGAIAVHLEVRPSSTAAVALYEAFGFVRTGLRKRYYQDGEDAILMQYTFT
ncbi:MAG TPA: ribosomal protein S18-alanine N-acetyltransferase [Geobacteraceae bacterium]